MRTETQSPAGAILAGLLLLILCGLFSPSFLIIASSMGAPLYFLMLCAPHLSMPCPANELRPEVYMLTREACLSEMRRYLAAPKLSNYNGYCIRWGGTEVIDDKGEITAGSRAGVSVSLSGRLCARRICWRLAAASWSAAIGAALGRAHMLETYTLLWILVAPGYAPHMIGGFPTTPAECHAQSVTVEGFHSMLFCARAPVWIADPKHWRREGDKLYYGSDPRPWPTTAPDSDVAP